MIEILVTWEAWAAALLLIRKRRQRIARQARRRSHIRGETQEALELLRGPKRAPEPEVETAAASPCPWPFAPVALSAEQKASRSPSRETREWRKRFRR